MKSMFDENQCETYPVPPPPLAPKFPEDVASEGVEVQMEVQVVDAKAAEVAKGGGRGSAVPSPKAPPSVKVDGGAEVDLAQQAAVRELAAKKAKEPKRRGRKPKAKAGSPNTKVASPADDKALRRNTPLKRKTPDKGKKQDAVQRNLEKDMEAAARAAQRKEVAVQALELLKGLEIDDLQLPGDGFDKLPLVYIANFVRTS